MKHTAKTRADVLALIRAGYGAKAAGSVHGVDRRTVRAWAVRAGLLLHRRLLTPDARADRQQAVLSGLCTKQICELLGVSQWTVRRTRAELRKLGKLPAARRTKTTDEQRSIGQEAARGKVADVARRCGLSEIRVRKLRLAYWRQQEKAA